MAATENTKVVKVAYRQLAEEVAENEEDMVNPDSDLLVKALVRGNTLFGKVKTASEGSEDSKLMAQLAYIGRKKVQELKTDTTHFRPMEFVDRLSTYTMQGQDGNLTGAHWSLLGKAVQSFFKKPPTCTFLLGSFAREPQRKKERVKRARMTDDNSKDKSTDMRKIANDDETLETTAHDVSKRILPQLIKLYKHNGKEPIDYYEFVTDPDSFGVTVENMFHISFLIRDGLAEIRLDDEGLPVIKPTPYGLDGTMEGRERELQQLPRRQLVNIITMQQWQEIKSTFNITKARIPPRKRAS